MRPFLFLGWLFALATGGAVARGAETRHFTSPAAPASLIELYTSEGCNSCPPMERWLGAMRDTPGLWTEFVPVAFHVDYWNRLGWPDKFSQKDFTQREYAYAAAWHDGSVYTPCVVRDGREWRPGAAIETAASRPVGVLAATYDGAVVRATFAPENHSAAADWEIHAALLGSDIASKVTAGENRGATLRHEFVALALVHGDVDTAIALPRRNRDGVPRYALAVWVTHRGELAPVQATGGWLDP